MPLPSVLPTFAIEGMRTVDLLQPKAKRLIRLSVHPLLHLSYIFSVVPGSSALPRINDDYTSAIEIFDIPRDDSQAMD